MSEKRCPTCGSHDRRLTGGGYRLTQGGSCPDPFHSPEADEQVGGERWTIYVCPIHGVREREVQGPFCNRNASSYSAGCSEKLRTVEVIPASSSIPTEKVREVVEWMRKASAQAYVNRKADPDQSVAYGARKATLREIEIRLEALVEGTDHG